MNREERNSNLKELCSHCMDDSDKSFREKLKKAISIEIDRMDVDVFDESDIGNIIGYAVGEFYEEFKNWETDNFVSGIRHGISLRDGTH